MFPLVTIPSTRYPSASALLVDESFQLFIKILRGHVQGMFVYTPPSWHPVLFSTTPSQPGEVSGEGRAKASSAGSFIHGPSPPFSFSLPSSVAVQLHSLPPGIHRSPLFVTLASAGRGLETFPASLPFGVCPHPLPSLPLTNLHTVGAGPVPRSGN